MTLRSHSGHCGSLGTERRAEPQRLRHASSGPETSKYRRRPLMQAHGGNLGMSGAA